MTVALGLNEFFHDTAACVVIDGRIAALVEQERLDRCKHAPGFALQGAPPWDAIREALSRAGVTFGEVDRIAVGFKSDGLHALAMLGRLVGGNLRRSHPVDTLRNRRALGDPAVQFMGGLTAGMLRRARFLRELSDRCDAPVEVVDHHRAHAASAFWPSGMEEAAVLVLDGMSDVAPSTLWHGTARGLRLVELVAGPQDSLGVLYRTVSLALGFGFMDAGKTMGLAAWGQPRLDFQRMLQVEGDGYRIDWGLVRRFCHRHGRRGGELGDVHRDLAASLQRQLEAVGVALARRAVRLTGARRIVLAGGVALNCNMNTAILREGGFEEVFVQPGAMDQGCALGAALEASLRAGQPPDRRFTVYCGHAWTDGEIEAVLSRRGLPIERLEDPAEAAAELLAQRRIVAWVQGPMEFGPRALGARSILANPDARATRDRVNSLKGREAWRPLAPSVLEEHLGDWLEDAVRSPYMTFTYRFKEHAMERVPGVIHEDGTARIQSVGPSDHPRYRALLEAFHVRTGLPMVINTSFNQRGEPIVDTPEQALDSFARMGLDDLVIGAFRVRGPGGA